MKLEKAVDIYLKSFAPKARAQLNHFRRLPTLMAAIEAGALATGADGKMLRHQRRVGKKVLTKAKNVLVARLTEVEGCQDFDELHQLVVALTRSIKRFGALAAYDTSLRIGAHLGLMPTSVYLHAGTKQGATALGLRSAGGTLERRDLPRPLRRLKMHQVEDLLCIFKDHFVGKTQRHDLEAFGRSCRSPVSGCTF